MSKKVNKNRGYATVSGDRGIDYRSMSETMTAAGFKMNHSSARNYVIRVMSKFVSAYSKAWDIKISQSKVEDIAGSPLFQEGIAEIINELMSG